jgi:hypothetical protein
MPSPAEQLLHRRHTEERSTTEESEKFILVPYDPTIGGCVEGGAGGFRTPFADARGQG